MFGLGDQRACVTFRYGQQSKCLAEGKRVISFSLFSSALFVQRVVGGGEGVYFIIPWLIAEHIWVFFYVCSAH